MGLEEDELFNDICQNSFLNNQMEDLRQIRNKEISDDY